MSPTTLITGGAGFIGCALGRELVAKATRSSLLMSSSPTYIRARDARNAWPLKSFSIRWTCGVARRGDAPAQGGFAGPHRAPCGRDEHGAIPRKRFGACKHQCRGDD